MKNKAKNKKKGFLSQLFSKKKNFSGKLA